MNRFICLFFLLQLSQFSYALKDQEISSKQCFAASTEIIKISEEALKATESKKNVKKLTTLVNDWKKRLDSKENACDLYQDILKSSANF